MIDMNLIKQKLEVICCPKCNKYPSVEVINDSFKINCCCDDFKNELSEIAENEAAQQSKKHIEEQMKRMFK